MQLPACVCRILPPSQHIAIIRLGRYFARIRAEVNALEIIYVHETLCILEVCSPSSFLGVVEHLVVHLVKETMMCGLVSGRWCYALYRFQLGIWKGYVRLGGKVWDSVKTKWVVGEVVEDGPRTHPKEMRSLKWNCILVYQLGEPKTTRNLWTPYTWLTMPSHFNIPMHGF